jgi:hypothetical protein
LVARSHWLGWLMVTSRTPLLSPLPDSLHSPGSGDILGKNHAKTRGETEGGDVRGGFCYGSGF